MEFVWYDLETFGLNPAQDAIAQFAGVRTDDELQLIETYGPWYCKPPLEKVIHPQAVMVTHITPQLASEHGVNEYQFITDIHACFTKTPTCIVGFNSARFDDQFIRYACYRNLYEPYTWHYQNGNSRWDVLDVLRLVYAIRPKTLQWQLIDGIPTFRLEHLTAANDISHNAHDALADVHATIALMKIVQTRQPKLFSFALQLRNKHAVAMQIVIGKPVLHISGMFPAAHGCAAIVLPIVFDPDNQNCCYVIDLSCDPQLIIQSTIEELRALLSRQQDGAPAIRIKGMHLNRSPMVMPAKLLGEDRAIQLGIDVKECFAHYEVLKRHRLHEKILQVMSRTEISVGSTGLDDVEEQLYNGFFNKQDMLKAAALHQQPIAQWQQCEFRDSRLPELFNRLKCRYAPATMSEIERVRFDTWQKQSIHTRLHTFRTELEELDADGALYKELLQYEKQLVNYSVSSVLAK